jgi:hypothetical protein
MFGNDLNVTHPPIHMGSFLEIVLAIVCFLVFCAIGDFFLNLAGGVLCKLLAPVLRPIELLFEWGWRKLPPRTRSALVVALVVVLVVASICSWIYTLFGPGF